MHLQKALSKKGTMWMNCVRVTESDLKQLVMTCIVAGPGTPDGSFVRGDPSSRAADGNQIYMKLKIERYYNLGASLAKCLGLFDCVNFVQYLFNLLEEYEVFLILQNQNFSQMVSGEPLRRLD